MTNPGEDFEARLTRVLKAGGRGTAVGQIVPPFTTPHALASRSGPEAKGPCAAKWQIIGIAVGLGLTGTAAAATIVHLTSAPVTENDLAAATQSTASLEAMNFRGVSVAAAGPIGSTAQVTTPSRPARSIWADGLIAPARERR